MLNNIINIAAGLNSIFFIVAPIIIINQKENKMSKKKLNAYKKVDLIVSRNMRRKSELDQKAIADYERLNKLISKALNAKRK